MVQVAQVLHGLLFMSLFIIATDAYKMYFEITYTVENLTYVSCLQHLPTSLYALQFIFKLIKEIKHSAEIKLIHRNILKI